MKLTTESLSPKTGMKEIKSAKRRRIPKEGDGAENLKEGKEAVLRPDLHRRILNFLNGAVRAEDLVYGKATIPPGEGDHMHEDNPDAKEEPRKRLLDYETARQVLKWRDSEYPLGFRHFRELLIAPRINPQILEWLRKLFSNRVYGSWDDFPVPIPRRGPGGYDGVVHAALLHTGKVLFITADETTLLWDPEDTTAATYDNPVNQPHLTPSERVAVRRLCAGGSRQRSEHRR